MIKTKIVNKSSQFLARGIVDECAEPSFLHTVHILQTDIGYAVIPHALILLKGCAKARGRLLDICGASSNKSVAEVKCEIHEIVLPLLNAHELNETVESIKNSHVPDFHHAIVTQLILLTSDLSANETNKIKVQMAVELLIAWIDDTIIAIKRVSGGFGRVSARIDDSKPDLPHDGWFYVVFVVALVAVLAQAPDVLNVFCNYLFKVILR